MNSQSALEGATLVAEARAQMLDLQRVSLRLREHADTPMEPFATQPILSATEMIDGLADLIVRYELASGTRLVAKRLLPVVKADPAVSFATLGDRGLAIDLRMNLFRELLPRSGPVRVPEAFWYDTGEQTLWMADTGPGEVVTRLEQWQNWLVPLARAMRSVHAHRISPAQRAQLESIQRREYLLSYPERWLKPLLDSAGHRRWWNSFRELDAQSPKALVHGDLAPKNCLQGADGALWLLDFDRSNIANPAYDIGVLLAHVLIQAWDAPGNECGQQLPGLLEQFWDAYGGATVGADFHACVRGYLVLIFAYRLGTLDYINTWKPTIAGYIRSGLENLLAAPLYAKSPAGCLQGRPPGASS